MDMNPALSWRVIEDGGYNSLIGPIQFAKAGENRWHGALKLSKKHMNFGGVCHGGVYMSLGDVTMGIAAHEVADGQRSATIDFDVHFLSAAKLGQTLVAEARVDRLVSGVAFMQCEIWVGARMCARAGGIWKSLNLPPRKAS